MAKRKNSVETPVEVVPGPAVEVVETAPESEPVVEPIVEEPTVEAKPDSEPIAEEPVMVEPKAEESTPTPVEVTQLGYNEVTALLNDSKTSLVGKLEAIAANGIPELKTVAGKLLDYERELGASVPSKGGEFAIGKAYDLNLILTAVANTVDKNKFKVKQDIITLAFIAFKDSAFSVLKLLAFDYLWKFGDKQLATYQNLTTVLTMLSDKSVRNENKSKVDINKLVDGTTLTDHARENLVSYYEL